MITIELSILSEMWNFHIVTLFYIHISRLLYLYFFRNLEILQSCSSLSSSSSTLALSLVEPLLDLTAVCITWRNLSWSDLVFEENQILFLP